MCNVSFSHPCHLHHRDYGKLYSLSSCSPIQCHCIQPKCHMQKVTVHAFVLLSDATVLSSPRSPHVALGERVLRKLISCPLCRGMPLTRSMFVFGTTEYMPSIIRTRDNIKSFSNMQLNPIIKYVSMVSLVCNSLYYDHQTKQVICMLV